MAGLLLNETTEIYEWVIELFFQTAKQYYYYYYYYFFFNKLHLTFCHNLHVSTLFCDLYFIIINIIY